MKEYTTNTPRFLKKINIVEENDLVNADNDTAAAKQLLQNDLVLDMRIKQCLGEDPDCGDSKDMVVTFESNDSESARSWEDIPVMKSKETHALLFHKISIMVRNIRYLYKLLGATDISKYGDGTVTDIISKLETEKIGNIKAGTVETSAVGTSAAVSVNKSGTEATINFKIPKGDTGPIGPIGPAGPSKISDSAAITIKGEYALDAREKNASIEGTLAHGLSQLNSNLASTKSITDKIVFTGTSAVGKVYFQMSQITYNGVAYDSAGFTISNPNDLFQATLWITWEGGCYYQVKVNGVVRPLVKLG